MKFFHVYNEEYFDGLVKNNLINQDTGFKLQHDFPMDNRLKFNEFAAKGTKFHSIIKENSYPFYVDRIAGGTTYHKYDFDASLIHEYEELLGDWFLGFQLHESASNRITDWRNLTRYMNGETGPFDLEKLKKASVAKKSKLFNGELLYGFSQGTPEEYAQLRRAETVEEYIAEIETLYKKYISMVDGFILPCDSCFLFTRMQEKFGIRTFMPEVGCQMTQMRIAVALVRGMAEAVGKTWGTYYECWMRSLDNKYSMPCFNSDPGNEWYLAQEDHGDDFTSFGEAGGSSRYLQKRIYYYSLMSGADYMAEEWGLNCSYSDMKTFELSPYGDAKKDFIDFTQEHHDVKANIPFAIVLPTEVECVELPGAPQEYSSLLNRDTYMIRFNMNANEKKFINHAEAVFNLIFARDEKKIFGTEGHTLTNSRFGDLFDIIYEDASDEVLSKYSALIDASCDGGFAEAKKNTGLKIFRSDDLDELAHNIDAEAKRILPCVADSLLWLLSSDENGRRFVSVFNNEGNNRNLVTGDEIIREADARVELSFKEPCELKCVKHGADAVSIHKKDEKTYLVDIPAAGFAIFEY